MTSNLRDFNIQIPLAVISAWLQFAGERKNPLKGGTLIKNIEVTWKIHAQESALDSTCWMEMDRQIAPLLFMPYFFYIQV